MSDDNTIELVRHLRIMARYEHGDMSISANAADEITRLRAENIHLRRAGMDRPSAELHEAALAELRAENERLRAEVLEQAHLLFLSGEREAKLLARVEVLEKHLGLMIVNNLTGSPESEGLATDRAIAVLPDWLEKANGYTRAELDAADENMKLHVEEAKP